MAKQDAIWCEIAVDTLSTTCKTSYDNYKAAYRAMKAARETFEQDMAIEADIQPGSRMIFGYNFGKLSVAIVADDRKPAKAKASTQSLAEFLAAQASAGRRV